VEILFKARHILHNLYSQMTIEKDTFYTHTSRAVGDRMLLRMQDFNFAQI